MQTKFKIPILPQSVNSLYKVNYRTRQVYLSDEGRQFKTTAKLYIPQIKLKKKLPIIDIKIKYFGKWHCKNGSVRRADGPNLDKVLFDAISEALGFDDCLIFYWAGQKIESDTDYTEVVIKERRRK